MDDAGAGKSQPVTTIVPRTAIRSVTLRGGEDVIYSPNDHAYRFAVQSWPGKLELELVIAGLDRSVVLSGSGIDTSDHNAKGAILVLLDSLLRDVNAAAD